MPEKTQIFTLRHQNYHLIYDPISTHNTKIFCRQAIQRLIVSLKKIVRLIKVIVLLLILLDYIQKMNNDYERLLREYNVPPGVLSPEQIRMLQHGGIRLDDSDGEEQYYPPPNDRPTQPRLPRMNPVFQSQSLRQIYQEQLSMKQKQLAYLQTELNHRDKLMDAQRHRLQSEHQLQMEKLLSELRNARSLVVKTEGQIPLIKEAIYRVKQMSTGMVSESVYLRLKDLPQKQLPPSQWIMVQVWQMIFPYKKDLEYHKRQVGKLRQEIKILNDKQHTLLNQLQHYSRLLSSKDDDQKRHALNYDNNRKSMELQIDKLREQVELIREKGARYDQLLRDYQFTKQQKELLQEKMGFYDKQASQNVPGGPKLSQEEAQRRKLQLLTQDKEYLTKENIQLIEKNRRLEDRLDRLEAQLLSQKNRSQQYLQQLLNLKTDSVSTYQQKIYRQISQLKEKHHHELQMSKNNLVDIYEKQLRFLKEAIEQKDLRNDILERNLRQKNKEHEQLMIDTRDFQRKFDGDLSETRIQLKIRTQELERVNNIYHETLGNLNAHKLENQMLRQKLNVVKGEYYKSQANAKDQMSSLKAQVAVLREQLANYQIIEKQIDQAVVSLAKISPNDNSIYTHTLNSIPTSNKRRIQQALGLAQRLQAKQREHEQTLQLLRRRQEELQKATNQLKIARSLLQKTNQPYSYLVSNIEDKEKQLLMLRNQNKKLDQNYENIKEEYRELKRQLQQAEKDVQRLLVKRQSIQNIQNILIELTRGPTTVTQINSAVQQIKDILGSTSFRKTGPLNINPPSQQIKPTSEPPSWYKKLVDKKK